MVPNGPQWPEPMGTESRLSSRNPFKSTVILSCHEGYCDLHGGVTADMGNL